MDIVKIPYLNPLQFRQVDDPAVCPGLKAPYFENKRKYVQKFQDGDIIAVQVQLLHGNYTSIQLREYDIFGNLLNTESGHLRMTNWNGLDIWEFRDENTAGSPPYSADYLTPRYWVIRVQIAGSYVYFASQPFQFFDKVENTVKIHYSHDGNNFDTLFIGSGSPPTQYWFDLRVEGGIPSDGFQPSASDKFYIDQVHDTILLDSIPFNVYKFLFGPGYGIPNWMANKINRILSLNMVEIDGKKYVKNEGAKLEPVREANYSLAGWGIELVLSENVYSIAEGSGNFLGDYNNDYNGDYF